MSKITDALKRATEQQHAKSGGNAPKPEESNGSVADKTLEAIQRWGVALNRPAMAPKAAAPVSPSPKWSPTGRNPERVPTEAEGRVEGRVEGPAVGANAAPEPAVQPPSAAPEMHSKPSRNGDPTNAQTGEDWDRAIEQCQAKLLSTEQQVTQQRWGQASLQMQVDVYQRFLNEADGQMKALRVRLTETASAAASMETARAVHLKRLEALRECQSLSHAVKMAEHELHTTGKIVTNINQSQQRASEELTQYQQRHNVLQQTVDQLRGRLGRALAHPMDDAQPTGGTS